MKNNWSVFCFALALFFLAAPALLFNYSYHDDLLFWVKIDLPFHPHYMFAFMVAIGRWLGAGVMTVVGWCVQDIHGLLLLRWVAYILMVVAFVSFRSTLKRIFGDDLRVWLVMLMLVALPAFVLILSWASLIPIAVSLVATGYALQRVLDHGDTLKNKCVIIVILVLSMALYAPTAMLYFVFVMFLALSDDTQLFQARFHQWLSWLIVGGLSMAVYALTICVGHYFFKDTITNDQYSPARVSFDFIGKIDWFLKEPLFNALNLWHIYPSPILAWAVAATIVALLYIYLLLRRTDERWLIIFMLGVTLFLSFLPNLVAKENFAFYRSAIGLTSYLLLVLVFLITKVLPQRWAQGVLVIMTVCGVLIGQKVLFVDRALPSIIEHAYTRQSLSVPNFNQQQEFIIHQQSLSSAQFRYNDFGRINADYPKDTLMIVISAMKDMKRKDFPNYIINMDPVGRCADVVAKVKYINKEGKWIFEEIGERGYIKSIRQILPQFSFKAYMFQGQTFALLPAGSWCKAK